MLFNSVQFFLFFVSFATLYWALPARARNGLLLAGSYLFYGMWDWRFLSLLALSTVVDYTVGAKLATTQNQRARKILLIGSLVVNLGMLGIFKYLNFFAASFASMLENVGLAPNRPLLNVLLPVGISFYTFQTMSYTIDVYRNRINPVANFIDFATFVAYFPQLVAGPIERAKLLLPQITKRERSISKDTIASGVGLIVLGLAKKVVLADGVAHIADRAFDSPAELSWIAICAGVLAFAIQIYGDFAGYTDIARGVSRLLGIELSVNFSQPYLSRSITEFWRRWHISLSNWLRDYLYISLGGNRRGAIRTYVNLMATMLLGGLWHGASWNFVVWGGLHGLYLVVHRLLTDQLLTHRLLTNRPRRQGAVLDRAVAVRDLPAIATTFCLVAGTWIFFRAPDFATSAQIFRGLAFQSGAWMPAELIVVTIAAIAMFATDYSARTGRLHPGLLSQRPALCGALTTAALAAIVLFSGEAPRPFVYFQF